MNRKHVMNLYVRLCMFQRPSGSKFNTVKAKLFSRELRAGVVALVDASSAW